VILSGKFYWQRRASQLTRVAATAGVLASVPGRKPFVLAARRNDKKVN
jgi:hypothetical protein